MIIQTPKKLLIICVLLPLAFVLPQVAEARFDSHQKRYMSNKDYASVFRQLFPLSTGSNDYKVKDCLKTD
ncbi:MAG: hypothetical protein KDD61_17260, partial [Bdellovibrionales bacterium]|nr:hypothetical protein [Bdellovibrionales bacterium]